MPLGARLRPALAGSLTPSDRVPTMGPMGGERGRKRAAEKAVSSRGGATRSGASSSGRQSTSAAPQVAAGTFERGPVLTNDDVLELQRTAGNRAVSTVMQRAAGPLDETVPGAAVADTLPQVPASSEGPRRSRRVRPSVPGRSRSLLPEDRPSPRPRRARRDRRGPAPSASQPSPAPSSPSAGAARSPRAEPWSPGSGVPSTRPRSAPSPRRRWRCRNTR